MSSKEHIVLLATKPEYAAAPQFAECINKYSNRFRASLVSFGGSHYKMNTQFVFRTDPRRACKIIDSADRLFLMDYRGLWMLFAYLHYKQNRSVKMMGKNLKSVPGELVHKASEFCISRKPAVFCTGSGYKLSYKLANAFFADAGFQIFAMTGLFELAPEGSLLLWHPYDPVNRTKRKTLTITHSPGKRATSHKDVKGTKTIRQVMLALRADMGKVFDYVVMVDKTHKACMNTKAESHIFIEQLAPSVFRGMGKSGLEAFAGGCVVMGPFTLDAFGRSGIPQPPAIITNNKREMYTALHRLISDKDYLSRCMNTSKAWRSNISLEHTAAYLDKHLL